ncbi:glycoside hydrolase family 3 N-terminal domain-containing protein [Carnobacterium gallinarum]|uniref:glycoside hydrolase family 3 N-terminal domain-containing protein n=1 Tax=Carnobacterium gallinarum TaxID=2749 RepID=UPI0005576697|nr:glycoside hydrolase family 3 N-terminal domain-containing protein [Carnobacterium gallinarum]
MKTVQIEDLLKEMTLTEKIAQLTQLTPQFFSGASSDGEITGPMAELGLKAEDLKNIGSVLGTHTAEEVMKIQEAYLKTNRLGIPLVFMADVIHGYRTIFPIPLAIGATWNADLAQKVAEISAIEASEAGVHVTFSPMVDLVRDPRWGRVMESTGEDAYLNSYFARAFVKGYQGEHGELATNFDRVAACVKHFAAYGAAEAGREYNTVDTSVRELYQNYLPAYQAAIEAGVLLVMTAFNTVDGIPATGNQWLMQDVLRKDLGFTGLVISDWGAVGELINHGVAENSKEAAYQSIQAGVDLEMMTSCYLQNLEALVMENHVQIEQIDAAVLAVLNLKNALGLFEDPYRGLKTVAPTKKLRTMSDNHRRVAREVAAESVVLLKNKNYALPLRKEQKIAVVGPLAESQDVLGAWSWIGEQTESHHLADGLKMALPNVVSVGWQQNQQVTAEELAASRTIAHDADIVVVALGESSESSGEAASLATIRLPVEQEQFLAELADLGKPVVTVVFGGRPLDLSDISFHSTALVMAWFPGTEAGTGIADVLSGNVSPSGKLPMSFPVTTGQVPVYYNHLKTGRPAHVGNNEQKYISRYLDIPNEPLYDFGFGLSYTTFAYSNVKQSHHKITYQEQLTFEVTVTNTGKLAGKETVQLYLEDVVATVARPVKELRRFEKIYLEAGESQVVTFNLTLEDLCYYQRNLDFKADLGNFNVYLGGSSQAEKVGSFELI